MASEPEKNPKKTYLIKQTVPTHAQICGKIILLLVQEHDDGSKSMNGLIDAGAAIFSFKIKYTSGLKIGDFVSFEEDGDRIDIKNRTW